MVGVPIPFTPPFPTLPPVLPPPRPPPLPQTPPIMQEAAELRVALYGGGAGVAAGFAVLGGGSGGNDEFVVLIKYGLPYAALYLGSMLRPF